MLIVMSLSAAALLAGLALPGANLPLPPPTLSVAVDVAPTIPPALVTYVLAESAQTWRDAGVQLHWVRRDLKGGDSDHRAERDPLLGHDAGASSTRGVPRLAPMRDASSGLRVTVGDNRGRSEGDPHVLPLGWIVFEAGSPQQEIYLSSANAIELLNASDFVVGRVSTLTNKEKYILLGRAMGRALAHEIGHYLLGSKAHTPTGIMQARRAAAELFSSSRRGFQVDVSQRQSIAARLEALIATSD